MTAGARYQLLLMRCAALLLRGALWLPCRRRGEFYAYLEALTALHHELWKRTHR